MRFLNGFQVTLLVAGATAAEGSNLMPISLAPNPSGTGPRIFVDSVGRQRIFHGVNAVVKGPPWVPATDQYSEDLSLVDEDFKEMAGMGLNMLRLGVMWPGVEPERKQYNYTYLQELKKIVVGAGKHGIYTLLDMHQDGISEKYCGEGIPYWALARRAHKGSFPLPLPAFFRDYYSYPANSSNAALFPSRQECSKFAWMSYQASKETAAEYESLYTNAHGMADAWAEMWAEVAAYFKGMPEVLGLELINEPFAGDFYKNPLIMVPHPNPLNADRSRLEPAYNRINAAVRKVDSEVLLFFAGVTWDDAGPGFKSAPGGEDYANRSVLAYHYYPPPQVGTRLQVSVQSKGASRLKTGVFLTETVGGNNGKGHVELFDAADEGLVSWAYWEFKQFCRDSNSTLKGKDQNGLWGSCKTGYGPAPKMYRPFAATVAGNATSMSFDEASHRFELQYAISTRGSLASPTQINLSPAKTYPGGMNIYASPPGAVTWKLKAGEPENSNSSFSRRLGYPPRCMQVTQDHCGTDYSDSCQQCGSSYECKQCCPGCELMHAGGAPFAWCQCGTGPTERAVVEIVPTSSANHGEGVKIVIEPKDSTSAIMV
jgi:endoglycosylceramidase